MAAACESGYKVLFTTLNDMVSVLMASMADNSFPSKLRQYIQPSLLIVDEVGYLPVSKDGANFLFQVVAKRCNDIGRQYHCIGHTRSFAPSLHDLQHKRNQLQIEREEGGTG